MPKLSRHAHYTSPDPSHQLHDLGVIPLGVHRVRHLSRGVSECELSRFKPKRPTNLRRGDVPQLVRVPTVSFLPRLEVFFLLRRQSILPLNFCFVIPFGQWRCGGNA